MSDPEDDLVEAAADSAMQLIWLFVLAGMLVVCIAGLAVFGMWYVAHG